MFDRCIGSPEDLPVDNPDYEVVLNYEFIDDVYNDWPCDIVRYEAEEGQKKGDVFTRKKIQHIMEQKETHTFSYMVRSDTLFFLDFVPSFSFVYGIIIGELFEKLKRNFSPVNKTSFWTYLGGPLN